MPSNAYDIVVSSCFCFICVFCRVQQGTLLERSGILDSVWTLGLCWVCPSSAATIPSSWILRQLWQHLVVGHSCHWRWWNNSPCHHRWLVWKKSSSWFHFWASSPSHNAKRNFPSKFWCSSAWFQHVDLNETQQYGRYWLSDEVLLQNSKCQVLLGESRWQGFKFWALCKVLLQLLWFLCFLPAFSCAGKVWMWTL